VNAYYKKALHRVMFIHEQRTRQWLDWERRPEHDHEDKYGKQPLPTYEWNELDFMEKRLYFKDEHSEMMESFLIYLNDKD